MRLEFKFIVLAVLGGATLLAQDPATAGQRKENQQDRIANGIQSGQLTTGETKRLENGEANLNREIHADRQADGGKLTAAEKQQVSRQQNRLSNRVYDDKHNARSAHYGDNEVGTRRQMQQDRIAQGVRSGSLRPGETSRLENREQGINGRIAADRKANGGRLTAQQKQHINRAQDRASRRIRTAKHN